MGAPLLILVQGVPGTGKTTLSRRLAKDTGLPCLGKDDVKELLYDRMGVGDVAWSQDQGAAASEMLFTFIDIWTKRGRDAIVESAFFASFAVPRIGEIVRAHNVACLEVYCKADPAVRRQRYIDRAKSGERHPGHVDLVRVDDMPEEVVQERYAPLHISDTIEFDMTVIDETKYQQLLAQVRTFITSHQEEG